MKSLFVSVLLAPTAGAFAPTAPRSATSNTKLHSSVSNLDELKASLVAKCTATPKTSLMVIRDAVDEVEALAEQVRPIEELLLSCDTLFFLLEN